jgi:hypothetical protein
MEGQAPVSAPVPAPAAAPMPMAQNPPIPAAPVSTMADGGGVDGGDSDSGGVKGFFKDINLLDVAISAFIVGGVIYAMQYFKYMMMLEKSGYTDLSERVQKLESSIQAAKKTAEMNASGMQKRRPVMRMR